MTRILPASIRGRAVLGSGMAIAAFGLLIGGAAYVVVTQSALTSTTATLEAQVAEIADQLGEQASMDPSAVDLEVVPASTPTTVQIVDADGAVAANGPGLSGSDRICPQSLPVTSATDRLVLTLGGTPSGVVRHAATVNTPSGAVTVCVVTSDQAIERAQEAVLLALAIALPLLVLGVCVLVWFAVDRALRAVDDLTSQADRMTSSADGQLRVSATHDEIEHLGNTFNALLGRLHHQTRATRQFVADAGHELRNPLSTLRVTLEFGEEADDDGLRESVQRALGDLTRLEALVQDLLVLARTDAMGEPAVTEDVDLAAVVEESVRTAQRARPDLQFTVSTDPCVVNGNGLAIRSLMANLLDNASRHATSAVDTALVVSRAQVRITVDDDGAGLPPDDCHRVFERFVRLDESRDRDEGGSGLGLAIVAAIAESHGGQAAAEPGPGGHFTVTLPI